MLLVEKEKCPKIAQRVSKIDKKGGFSSKIADIDSKYDSFIHFTIKINSKDLIHYQSFWEYSSQKNHSKSFFPRKFILKI